MIFDELSRAEEILKNKNLDFFRIKDLTILAKYFRYNEMDWKETEAELLDYCKSQTIIKYEDSLYCLIEKAIKGAKKYKLRVPVTCAITKRELEDIESINNFKTERVFFVIMCLAKYSDATDTIINRKEYDEKKVICWEKSGVIFKLARYCNNFFDRNMIIGEIERAGFIKTIPNKNFTRSGIVLNTYYPDSEPVIYFNNPENVYKLYKAYKDGKLIKCAGCGISTIRNSNRQEFCEQCWKEKELERQRVKWHKYKENYRSATALENPANR